MIISPPAEVAFTRAMDGQTDDDSPSPRLSVAPSRPGIVCGYSLHKSLSWRFCKLTAHPPPGLLRL